MKTDRERMADLRERRKAAGLKQVTVWLPEDEALRFRQQAALACERALRGQEAPTRPVAHPRPSKPPQQRQERSRAAARPPPPLSPVEAAQKAVLAHIQVWCRDRPPGVSKTKARQLFEATARKLVQSEGLPLSAQETTSLVAHGLRTWW